MRSLAMTEEELQTLAKAFDAGTRAIVAESGIAALHQLNAVLLKLEASEALEEKEAE